MSRIASFIDGLAMKGRYHFTTKEVVSALDRSPIASRAAIRRLARKGAIASPYRGFHVIVPPEYRSLGCLPPEQFVPQLMQSLDEPYYVALLSAAELHGAAHQRPQVFQVMVSKNRRPIECGGVRVRFFARKDLGTTPVVEMKSPRGFLRVSSQEATALELVGYADQCGGLNHVISVLQELAETIEPKRVLVAAQSYPIAWVQRLGFLLSITDHSSIADALATHVAGHAQDYVPLIRANVRAKAQRDSRWRIIVNGQIDPDQ